MTCSRERRSLERRSDNTTTPVNSWRAPTRSGVAPYSDGGECSGFFLIPTLWSAEFALALRASPVFAYTWHLRCRLTPARTVVSSIRLHPSINLSVGGAVKGGLSHFVGWRNALCLDCSSRAPVSTCFGARCPPASRFSFPFPSFLPLSQTPFTLLAAETTSPSVSALNAAVIQPTNVDQLRPTWFPPRFRHLPSFTMNHYPSFNLMFPDAAPPPVHQHSVHQLNPQLFAAPMASPEFASHNPFEPQAQASSSTGKTRPVKISPSVYRQYPTEKPKSKHSSCTNCRKHKVSCSALLPSSTRPRSPVPASHLNSRRELTNPLLLSTSFCQPLNHHYS